MIKKIYIFIILFFVVLSTQSQAYDCYFNKIKPGVDARDLQTIGIRAVGQNEFGGFEKFIVIEDLCKNPEGLSGIVVQLFFLKNKLVKINFQNVVSQKQKLFDIAQNDYKVKFERIEAKSKKNQSEIYSATKNGNYYFYALLKNENQQGEYLEIMSNKDREKIDEYFLKMEVAQPND